MTGPLQGPSATPPSPRIEEEMQQMSFSSSCASHINQVQALTEFRDILHQSCLLSWVHLIIIAFLRAYSRSRVYGQAFLFVTRRAYVLFENATVRNLKSFFFGLQTIRL